MINASYILVFSDASYAKRNLLPMFVGEAYQRLSRSFSRCSGLE